MPSVTGPQDTDASLCASTPRIKLDLPIRLYDDRSLDLAKDGSSVHSGNSFNNELAALEEDGLKRRLAALPAVGGKLSIDGKQVLNFSSNDYLDLANDPRLKEAAMAAVDAYGCGATASRLMAGDLVLHEQLETRLAKLVRHEASLVFASGFQANLGAITTLAGEDGVIFSDELNHASIVDGCRLAKAQVLVYRHRDMEHLEELLRSCQDAGRRVVVSDAVFSMDGDLAPVTSLRGLADRHGAYLLIDEAHGLGVFGRGAGLCAERGVRPDVIVANMTKALGSGGGFVAASRDFIDLLLNTARSFIFSTGLAPACAGSALRAVEIVEAEPGLGQELLRRSRSFRDVLQGKGFDIPDHPSQIIPLVIGSNQAAVAISDALLEQGVLITAVRPPSVPEGTARLRLSTTLAHAENDLRRAADVIASIALEAGVL
ncbi:MAG: 8-amino-7-oxononanoate synthase [Candidatus Hydrogenedentes bacterium]|nr:8-amino-7-oxononanoate synthase [Candidatus Hydrogenedentota bacterium]